MANSPLSQTQQIGDFFTVAESFPVNLHQLEEAAVVPDEWEFESEMPELFTMASNMAGSDQDLLQQLKMDSHQSPVLVQVLEQMNQRMITMLGYLLRYEDDPKHRFQGTEFGGGGIRLITPDPIDNDTLFRAKLFFKNESLAIYCYLRCSACESLADEPGYSATFEFERILEQDQEHLIRASLHSQSRQLKRRAQERDQSKNNSDDNKSD
ncbi:MAG: PilZ domain-containing protein [Idiomarina sp.]|uniref:PilZ domain-containing protein n=1 Tax=Idiomarina aquatica TaxID=1327752 RepID=A0A4R6PIQ6_9GAMM|nr:MULTISPECIES: PilZ domain-containing protein [Idiomarina]MBT41683.1 PilZ domain-containing protein [Idiomarina sp.]TDP38258.1 hypothetical protein DEU29_105110 [Idiomarina aquatica]